MSLYDNHPADAGSETFEREKDLGLYLGYRRRLQQIDEALGRMEQGSYGTCRGCGRPIPPARLAAVPDATLCHACKAEEESPHNLVRRPVEEGVLHPPFGRTFDVPDSAAYDGEDAWQEVGSYGTSETPQDTPGALGYEDMYRGAEPLGVVSEVEAVADEDALADRPALWQEDDESV